MDADIEARVRELEIASSVHSINTKRLESNSLTLVQDIKDIKEAMNISLGKSGAVSTIAAIATITTLSYFAWVSIHIMDHEKKLAEMKTQHNRLLR